MIDLIPGEPVPRGKIYPLSLPEQKAMEEYVEEALKQGYIVPSTSPAASSFFFVAKKDKGLWPCIDYRALNNITIKFCYPLPLVPAALEQLRGATIFTKLDLCSAYNLIRIRKGDEWKTAFVTPIGHYQPSVQFLGYVIDHTSIHMDEGKIQAISSWPLPTTIKELQRFLGFTNFYRRFIRNYSAITSPITNLLRGKSKSLSWTPAATEAFTTLKGAFTSAPLLVHPNPELPFMVEVNAFTTGVGVVLSQRQGNPPKLHPCALF